ncbi:MAG TPA: hypothetical protein VJ801_14690 [Polyangia bacterium]|jgi:hypothetical protein|nr:hypothetical protein [Polyangia bacterium]
MGQIITTMRRGRLPSWDEIGQEMSEQWGSGSPHLELTHADKRPGMRKAWLVVFPPGEQVADGRTENQLTQATAELAWWQKSNRLIGYGIAPTSAEAAEQALACARRGNLARAAVEVWFDRASRTFHVFRCSIRDPDSYRPSGSALSLVEIATLSGQDIGNLA